MVSFMEIFIYKWMICWVPPLMESPYVSHSWWDPIWLSIGTQNLTHVIAHRFRQSSESVDKSPSYMFFNFGLLATDYWQLWLR